MCPSCGSHDLKRGEQNLWCNSCGYFPIPFEREMTPIVLPSPTSSASSPLEMLLEKLGTRTMRETKYFHVEDDTLPVNITVDGLDLQVIGMEDDGTLLCMETPKE
jgi:hypothetical protein